MRARTLRAPSCSRRDKYQVIATHGDETDTDGQRLLPLAVLDPRADTEQHEPQARRQQQHRPEREGQSSGPLQLLVDGVASA